MAKRPFKRSDDSKRTPFNKRDSGKSFGDRKGRSSFGDADRPKSGGRFKKSDNSFGGSGSFKRTPQGEDSKGPFGKSNRSFSDRKEGGDRFKKSGGNFSPRGASFKRKASEGDEGPFRKSNKPFSDKRENSDRFKKSGSDFSPRGGDFKRGPRKDFDKPSFRKSSRPFTDRKEDSGGYSSQSGAFKRAPRKGDDAESDSFRKSGRSFSEKKSGGSFARPGGFRKREDRDDKGSFKKASNPFSKKTSRFAGAKDERPFRRRDSDSEKPNRFSKDSAENSFAKRPRKAGGFDRTRDVKKIDTKAEPSISKSEKPDSVSFSKKAGDGELIRLNKFMANSGVGSRRQADEYIAMGLVTVNGIVVTEMGHKVKPTDEVRYEGKKLKAEKPVYILLNKPKGFITTTDDPQDRNTVMHLIANACKERVYPVGRLDRNTTGLLLLTNDGDVADKLTHPSYNVKKIYKVELDKPITKNDLQKIAEEGVYLEEGRAKVDDIAVVSDDYKTLGVELHIGWNRIVRRIFESFGYEVMRLDRVAYAGLDKKDLGRGEWRFLKPEEIMRLKHFK